MGVLPYNPIWTDGPQGSVNVLNPRHGAYGDGVHDDTAAIQSALTAAGGPDGGPVYIPYTSTGYLCGAVTVPPGVRVVFGAGAKLIAPSKLKTSWVVAEATEIHNGTAVIGGTFDASATTSTGVTAVIDFSQVTSCPNVRIMDNRIINAPVHGIKLGEGTGSWTAEAKWIERNSVDGHGVATTGFGIYCDYIGNVHILDNFVTSTSTDDAIELGHSGPAHLGGLNARLFCVHNHAANGAINFPFSDYALIEGNTVGGNTIQNDENTANNVTIVDNLVIDPSIGAGYAGIVVAGDRAIIAGNTVVLNGAGVGIQGDTVITTNTIIRGNTVRNTSSTAADLGIGAGGYSSSTDTSANNTIEGNQILGAFSGGIDLIGSDHQVRGNMLDLTGASYGINLVSSTVTGNVPAGCVIQGNYLSGATTAIEFNDSEGTVTLANTGYNPVGVQTVSVPSSGTAVSAAPYARVFYVTAASSGCAMAVQDGPTITIPDSALATVVVPASKTVTPTYTSAPTWVVDGR